MLKRLRIILFLLTLGLVSIAPADCGAAQAASSAPALRWWKGNLHTHSLWSDGDDYPEMVVDWYKQHGYQFLAISDHNVVMSGIKWVNVSTNESAEAFNKYIKRFGEKWVDWKLQDGRARVKLKTFSTFRPLFEEPGKFILIPGEEITAAVKNLPIHLNGTNLKYLIKPRKGDTVLEVLQRNVDAVLEQEEKVGQPMLPHINHPNFGWGITAEDLMQVKGERFFEVYNGHPTTNNEGDTNHVAMDRMWDIVLAHRLTQGLGVMFGMAVDDAHNYHRIEIGKANPGRGWIMVRTGMLTGENIVRAMKAGEFYASSGVRLHSITRALPRYEIAIEQDPGASYTTTFIGTRRGFDTNSTPILSDKGEPLAVTRKYTAAIGEVLAVVKGPVASYVPRGDEIYVRAKIVSSNAKTNGSVKGEFETAWTQPLVMPAPAR